MVGIFTNGFNNLAIIKDTKSWFLNVAVTPNFKQK
jgi:hypothetical protein